jgi:hypothetical protein
MTSRCRSTLAMTRIFLVLTQLMLLGVRVVNAVDTATANSYNPSPSVYILDATYLIAGSYTYAGIFTPGSFTYTVKSGVTSLYVALCGASGGGSYPNIGAPGGTNLYALLCIQFVRAHLL